MPRLHRSRNPQLVALLTDFGFRDSYVGVMKGVIYTRAPEATIVDLCHHIVPQDVIEAGFVLASAYPYFPDGTIFVCVVDPGVGTARRILCMETDRHVFLAPDNGLLSVFAGEIGQKTLYEVSNQRYFLERVSDTFHGRDIFAPVAAALATGVEPSRLGPAVPKMASADLPLPIRSAEGVIRGQVIYVDQFGNIITNITETALSGHGPRERLGLVVRIKDRVVRGLRRAYAEVAEGELLALMGSAGYLEISVNRGNAQKLLQTQRGDEVLVSFERAAPPVP